MGTTTQWILELVDKITSPMKGIINASDEAASAVEGVGTKADKSGDKLKGMSAIDLYAISDAVNNIADEFNKINEPGAAFNAQMKELEAISGVTGDALEAMGDKGRATAKDFGGDASAMLESYKGILGKLGPDIAQNSDALDLMGRNVATLSKTMKGDAVGAMNALTGSMLQFNSDIQDPMEMATKMTEQMNIMAAASKEGSAEVPFITQSIKQAGTAAKNANVTFAETNAVIQALGKGAIYGSEAGVGLRNMLGKMSGIDVIPKNAVAKMEALGINYDIVSDKTRPFVERLKELQKAQSDATLIAQIFGVENQNAANVILNNIGFIEDLQGKIVGTNTATEQANIIMSGYTETMSRVGAWFTDLKISMFDVTSKMTPFVDGLAGAVTVFANMANAGKGVQLLFNTLKTMPVIGKLVTLGSTIASSGFTMMSTAAKGLGVAIMNIPIIGWIAAIVAGLIALGAYFWKTSETFRKVLMGVWEFIKTAFLGYYKFIWNILQSIWDLIKKVFNPKNWFDSDFSFADAFKDAVSSIKDAAVEYGTEMGESYAKGAAKGAESWKKDNPVVDPELNPDNNPKPVGAIPINKVSPVLTPGKLTANGSTTAKGLSGSGGSGSIKNVNQRIDVKNYFTIAPGADKSEFESIAEKIVRAINDKLSDSMVAASM
ncbi:phage tail tape measure protein [Carboxylicivirga linearis]|uniref:Phage tail tape measure protein n=1 Tax=Carboxylicivirga linearis TaxID=1628157 RepID=A0ABS5JXK6_9BACT|nr:phage tail tape measure protein [Carboxylicivirga linearis]MBS2099189.1 phage tail tape measure protein [Carboxylicivirga linearis]